MGYALYREVMRYAPNSLTKGEKLAAMVLADDANDDTRTTWSSVVDPEIMRQAMVPDERAMLRIIARLKAEKVIEHSGGGHNGKVAKYKFIALAPADAPAKGGEKDHPTNGKGGENHPATEHEGWQESPPNGEESSATVHKITTQRGGKGGDFLHGRVVKTTTPTPLPPTTASSSSKEEAPAEPAKKKRPRVTTATANEQPPRSDVEAICEHLADTLERTGSKRPTITAKWRTAARLLIDKDEISVERAKRAIDWAHADDFWQAHILTPMKLREKYDTLRRKAAAEQRKAPGRPGGSVRDPIPDWNDPNVEVNL